MIMPTKEYYNSVKVKWDFFL